MNVMTYRGAVSALLLILLSACAPPSDPAPSTPRPVVTVTTTATATVSPTPMAVLSPTPATSKEEVYRVRAEFLSSSELAFEVSLNGQKVGSFNTDSVNDVSPIVRPGANEVQVSWSKATSIEDNGKALFFVESQRPGQESWNTLFSREVTRTTKDTSATGAFQVGAASAVASPLSPTPSPPDASPSLQGRYVIKIEDNGLAPAEFRVSINGGPVQAYTGKSDMDITAELTPGKNTIKVDYMALKNVSNSAWKSIFTIGVERDGNWTTVGNQVVGRDDQQGSRSFTFTAQ